MSWPVLRPGRKRHEYGTPFNLTPCELRVMELLVNGYTNPEIAGLLGLAESTIKYHVTSIFFQMGVRNRVEAAVLWIRDVERNAEAA